MRTDNSSSLKILSALLLLSACFSGSRAFAPSSSSQRLSFATTTRGPMTAPVGPSSSSRTTTTATTTKTELFMVEPTTTGVALAAITGAVTGGLFSGGLHAIAGPDHLAALLPRCCGQRWWKAGRVGALWGMGHGVSATLLGIVAFAIKKSFHLGESAKSILASASHVTELAVGLSLILIGIMGIREAREYEAVPVNSLSAAANDTFPNMKTAQKRAVIFNGLLHGFSWDGAPSLAPALAVASWSGNLAFLSAYAVGTMSAMAIVTTLVGEGTRRAGELFQRPDLPQKLSFASSLLAIGIGAVWCILGFL